MLIRSSVSFTPNFFKKKNEFHLIFFLSMNFNSVHPTPPKIEYKKILNMINSIILTKSFPKLNGHRNNHCIVHSLFMHSLSNVFSTAQRIFNSLATYTTSTLRVGREYMKDAK